MNSQFIHRQNKGVSQEDLNPNESDINDKKVVASTDVYYSEWAIEKSSTESPTSKKNGKFTEPASGNAYQTTIFDQYY